MRTYRFVRFLGDRVAAASREIAATTRDEGTPTERLDAGDDSPHAHVRRELPQVVASHLDGATKGPTRIEAETISIADRPRERTDTSPDLGIVYHAHLPDFELSSAMVAKVVDGGVLEDPEFSLAEATESEALDRLLGLTADAFVFVVTEASVQVVPAQAVASLTDPAARRRPHRTLYSRGLRRTVEEFAEGFVGDGGLAPTAGSAADDPEADAGVREWAIAHDISGVLHVRVESQAAEAAPTLQDFVE